MDKPNILFIITDDQSWQHAGCYGDKTIRTSAIDQLAEEGVRFTNAYCAAPSCSPSRAAILSGQDIYRLEEAGVLTGFIRDKFTLFPKLLEDNGYAVGFTGKGYWPRTVNAEGISQNNYPGNFADYMSEIEWTDKMVDTVMQMLENRNLLQNTLIVFTSDNGMPLPRAKSTLYDYGVRMPLIYRWDHKIKRTRPKLDAYLVKTDDPRSEGLYPWDNYNFDKPYGEIVEKR